MTRQGFTVSDGIIAWYALDPFNSKNIEEVFLNSANEVLSYAKANAPWTDRTGNARSGLDVSVDDNGGEISLQLYHTVDHGLWLELIQNGRFAIIMPTLQKYAPEIFRKVGAQVAIGMRR